MTFARPRSAVRSASLARGCRYARRGCNRGMAHHPARQVDRPRSANACAEPRSGVTTSAGCTTDGLRPWNRSGNPRHPVGHQEGPAVEALTPASPDSLPPLGDLIADEPFWRYPAGATGRALPTSAGGSPRIPSPATWPWSPRPGPPPGSPSLRSTSGPLSPAGTGPRLSCSSTTRHHPAPKAGEGGETLDVGVDGCPQWMHAWPTPEENPRHAGLELRMAVYGYRIVSRPASAFDRCEDEGRS